MGAKAMKRRFAKKVINGSMTVDEAWNRLDRPELEKRDRQARQAVKSAGSTRPSPPAVYEPGREAEYLQSAFAPMTLPQQQPTTIQKARQRAADRQYEQQMAPMRGITELLARAGSRPATYPLVHDPVPRPVVKQLSQPERAMVAELRGELACVAHIPARREEVRARILRITGDPFTPGAV